MAAKRSRSLRPWRLMMGIQERSGVCHLPQLTELYILMQHHCVRIQSFTVPDRMLLVPWCTQNATSRSGLAFRLPFPSDGDHPPTRDNVDYYTDTAHVACLTGTAANHPCMNRDLA